MKNAHDEKDFNVETAIEYGRRSIGDSGSPQGYEERLYQTLKGDFFLAGLGGTYVEPTSFSSISGDYATNAKITALANHEAEMWAKTHLGMTLIQAKAEAKASKKREKEYRI